jgi:hypothetical protein
MPNPIKVCIICDEPFELLPNKPGLINQCPSCVAPKSENPKALRQANLLRTIEVLEKTIKWHESEIERIKQSGRVSGIEYQEEQIKKYQAVKEQKQLLVGASWES